MITKPIVVLAVGLVVTLAVGVRSAAAADIPSLRTEQEQRLQQLDHETLDLQRKLFTASMSENQAEVVRLTPEFKAMDRERNQLRQALGQGRR